MELKFDDFVRSNPDLNQYIKVNNCKYGKEGENTPIPNKFLKTLPNNEVIIPFGIFRELFNLARETSKTDCEHCFFLLAENKEGEENKCTVTNFFASNSQLNRMRADFDDKMIKAVKNLAENVKNGRLNGNLSLFVGHTHPARGIWYDNFSFADLKGYARGAVYGNDVYEKRLIETAGCMLTADGKIRMCFFDPDKEDFYAFNNIKVKNSKGIYDFEYFFEGMVKELKKQRDGGNER